MTVEAAPRRNGLAIVWDTIVAPGEAFEALRERTHWGWAYAVVCVLGIGGALLQIPATVHLLAVTLVQNAAHDPNMAALAPEKQQQVIAQTQQLARFSWVFPPIVAILAMLVSAGVMLIGSAIAKGHGRFVRLFGLAANVAVINFGLGYLLIGVLVTLRGVASFSSQRDMLLVMPSLAWFAPGASPKLVSFLSGFSPFQFWSFALLALGLGKIAGVARGPALVIAALVAFGGALFAVPFAK